MTEVPFRPATPRDSGDAWVEGPDGRRYWGRYGAAGLLVHDTEAGILLQHRAEWSHFGGTWGLPGGARHQGESAVDGAIREAEEEAGVPSDALEISFTSVFDLGYWSYVTVVTRAARSFDPVIGDAESLELRWVPVDEVETLPLHPGFGSAWPALRDRLGESIRVVVDAANVVGSRPDGWWRDRLGAAEALIERVGRLSASGIDSAELELGDGLLAGRSWPRFGVVVEGQARSARTLTAQDADAGVSAESPDSASAESAAASALGDLTTTVGGASGTLIDVVRAEGSGDDEIVAEVSRAPRGASVVVVTADRELSERVRMLGASVRGPGWLLRLLDAES
ncbi:NUDIX domain-containing protein [Herbiconiux sp. YIM B11900]|uniref:NUDIX domain-containing protein n=1 Tax=Herbiconiux sp. YIM B11900 TaxID=3404131 RepID=UPI003F841157